MKKIKILNYTFPPTAWKDLEPSNRRQVNSNGI